MSRGRMVRLGVVAVVVLAGTVGCAPAYGLQSAASRPMTVADQLRLVATTTARFHSASMTMQSTDGTYITGRVGWSPFVADVSLAAPPLEAEGLTSMHELMVDGTIFVMPLANNPEAPAPFDGEHWIRMSPGALGTSLATMVKNGKGPSTGVQLITSARDAVRLGEERINGVLTTHYRGTPDIAAQAAAAGMSVADLRASMARQKIKSVPVDLWVDQNNLPVKFRTPSAGLTVPEITAEFSNYDSAPFTVTPPPASDIVDPPANGRSAV
jgi:hypothetical protein